MKFNIKHRLSQKNNRIIISLIIVIIIIVALIASSSITLLNSESDSIEARIYVDNQISRLDDGIYLDGGNSTGTIKSYHWDLGDGNTSNEVSLTHHYEFARFYEITLEVQGEGKIKSNASVIVGVQMPDEERTYSRGPGRVFQRNHAIGEIFVFLTHPNIGDPTSEGSLHVTSPVGTVELKLGLEWYDASTGWHTEYYHQEEYTATGNDIDIQYEISPDEFPDEVGDNFAHLFFFYLLHTGRDGGVEMTASVVYPDGEIPQLAD